MLISGKGAWFHTMVIIMNKKRVLMYPDGVVLRVVPPALKAEKKKTRATAACIQHLPFSVLLTSSGSNPLAKTKGGHPRYRLSLDPTIVRATV